MNCPKCQIKTSGTEKYCRECGARLLSICSQCGSEILPYDKFCSGCGLNLKGEKGSVKDIEGERKHVTVLFSDLSGYTALSEKLDPEDVKEIFNQIAKEIPQVIAKYDGFLARFIGDAVMAVFGVPKAHEDDPARAVRAAKE